jgi:hypothetical protein
LLVCRVVAVGVLELGTTGEFGRVVVGIWCLAVRRILLLLRALAEEPEQNADER